MADPSLRDEVLRVLTAATGPLTLADIAAELGLSREDRAELAGLLHRLKASGAIAGEPTGEKGRRKFRYRLAEGAADAPQRARKAARRRHGVTRKRPRVAPREPFRAACEALEQALAAMVKDPGVMAAVRAYGAFREAIARGKP